MLFGAQRTQDQLREFRSIRERPRAETPSDASEYAHVEGVGGFRYVGCVCVCVCACVCVCVCVCVYVYRSIDKDRCMCIDL